MATRLRWLGHAAILIEAEGRTILIDPFLTGNPAAEGAGIKARDFKPDAILLSHGHDDHLGDLVEIARRSGASRQVRRLGAAVSTRSCYPHGRPVRFEP